ncbi:MAG: hypothetical protein ACRD3D_04760 [Terriglobia bacterium]
MGRKNPQARTAPYEELVNGMRRNKSTAPFVSLDTLETLISEVVDEGARPYEDLALKLRRAKPGTRRYADLLAALSAVASVIAVKAKVVEEATEEYLQFLPDDDDD